MSSGEFVRSNRITPGPRDWILDLFGSFVRDFGGWIAVADLLTLLDSLGVNGQSGRSALSRMKRQGELMAISSGSTRGYSLTEAAERWFVDGTARIMEGPALDGDDLWVIAAFSVSEQDRNVRYRIRTRLQDLGFGQLAGGLMIAPSSIAGGTERALDTAGLTDYVDLWRSDYVGPKSVEEIVRSAWDLDLIRHAYRDYLRLAAELEASSPGDAQGAGHSEESSFVAYMTHINAWRELPFIDPGIPYQHLPDDWPAAEARSTFNRLAAELRPAAWRYFVRTTSKGD